MKVFSVKELNDVSNSFKSDEFYINIANIIKSKAIIRHAELQFLSKYLVDDTRDVEVDKLPNGNLSVYVTNGLNSNDACLLEAGHGFLKIAEIKYKRVGNGINQEGDLFVRVLKAHEDKVIKDSYSIGIGNLTNLSPSFAIRVNPKNLVGFRNDSKMTDILNKEDAFRLFRKPYLKGDNIINNQHITLNTTLDEQQVGKIR